MREMAERGDAAEGPVVAPFSFEFCDLGFIVWVRGIEGSLV